jgi:hypothetical protein
MSTIKHALAFVGALIGLTYAATATPDLNSTLIFDDFNDIYGDAAHQSNLSAVKYWAQTGKLTGAGFGYWYKYTDGMFVIAGIASHDTLGTTTGDMTKINDGKIMHFFFKLDPSSSTAYPGGEVSCSFFTETDTLNFTKMTAISLKAKGTGTIRISIKSHNIADAGDWGFCSDTIKLTTTLTPVNIPVSRLVPAPYSASAKATPPVTWTTSRTTAFAFQIKAENSKEAEVYIDSIVFEGMKYSDVMTKTAAFRPFFSVPKVYSNSVISINNSAVSYTVDQPRNVSVSLFNADGKEINNLFTGNASAGTHSVALPKSIIPGTYFVRMNNDQEAVSQKFTIVK